jgi:hypothetical protein
MVFFKFAKLCPTKVFSNPPTGGFEIGILQIYKVTSYKSFSNPPTGGFEIGIL